MVGCLINEVNLSNSIPSIISFLAGAITISTFLYFNYKYGLLNKYHLHQLEKEKSKLYLVSELLDREDVKGTEILTEKIKASNLVYFSLKLNSANPIIQKEAIFELYQLSKDKVFNDTPFEILVRRVGSNPPLIPANKLLCLNKIKELCEELYCPEKNSPKKHKKQRSK